MGFAGVGAVTREVTTGSGASAGCPAAGDVGVVWRQSFTGGEIQVEVLGHPAVTVGELSNPISLAISLVDMLHGIMSAIAEFYSQNLATEVKKGMSQKVKNGGTPTKAPIGYRNIRAYDTQINFQK